MMKKLHLILCFVAIASMGAMGACSEDNPTQPESTPEPDPVDQPTDTTTVEPETLVTEFKTDWMRDLCLIYQGGGHRIDWTEEQFKPYVSHKFADGTHEWLFDGFLFLEIWDEVRRVYYHPTESGYFTHATKADLEYYLERLFESGKALDALDKCITSVANEIGPFGQKHKIVLTVFSPMPGQTDWGEVDGKVLDFSNYNYEDMATACEWFIDKMVDRFYEQNYTNLELAGLYWLSETTSLCKEASTYVAPIVHKHGLRFCWIPYYVATGYNRWQELGFDVAYHQPNYFFNTSIEYSRFADVINRSNIYNMQLEFEFDEDALHDSGTGKFSRMEDYIDNFYNQGIYDNNQIAYYTGNHALIEFANSTNPWDHYLADRFAGMIVARRTDKTLPTPQPLSAMWDGTSLEINALGANNDRLNYVFKNCMANDLFTFYTVKVNNYLLNAAQISDNIGPFLTDSSWMGGNHLYTDNVSKTAFTQAVKLSANGEEMATNVLYYPDSVNVTVANILYDNKLAQTFADETMKYCIAGNSIDVRGHHDYKQTRTVSRYYGMQSMFDGEEQIYTHRGGFDSFTTIYDSMQLDYADYPNLQLFVEKSSRGYQASYLLPEGMGDHRYLVNSGGLVFLGHDNGKSYHCMMYNHPVEAGTSTDWHGVYSWFSEAETVSSTHFEYQGWISGKHYLISAPKTNNITVKTE